jgi:hypothetical protein
MAQAKEFAVVASPQGTWVTSNVAAETGAAARDNPASKVGIRERVGNFFD